MIKAKITRHQNLTIEKTTSAIDPFTKKPCNFSYTSQEWIKTLEKDFELPDNPHTLQILSFWAGRNGLNQQGEYSADCVFSIEMHKTQPNAELDSKEIEYTFVCHKCNMIEFDLTAKTKMAGIATVYCCSSCDTELHVKQK